MIAPYLPTRHCKGAVVLLGTVNPIREVIIGDDVVELARRLVVPRAPRLPTIDGDDDALVASENHAVVVDRIDPQRVEIVTGRIALDRGEGLAAVGRAIRRRIHDVHDIGILRIGGDAAEIPAALPDA